MKVNIRELVVEAGLEDDVYPGKRAVKNCALPGQNKSHSVAFDWRNPSELRITLCAGLGGRELSAKERAVYPISFQSATFFEIETETQKAKREDDEEREGKSGGRSGDSRRLKSKPEHDSEGGMRKLFDTAHDVDSAIPTLGDLKRAVVMGMEIAKDAAAAVLGAFIDQLKHGKILASNLLAQAGQVTRYTPPSFMKPVGNETAVYQYDRTKNEPMFGGLMPSG